MLELSDISRRFAILHRAHIQAIQRDQLVLAREISGEIDGLLYSVPPRVTIGEQLRDQVFFPVYCELRVTLPTILLEEHSELVFVHLAYPLGEVALLLSETETETDLAPATAVVYQRSIRFAGVRDKTAPQ